MQLDCCGKINYNNLQKLFSVSAAWCPMPVSQSGDKQGLPVQGRVAALAIGQRNFAGWKGQVDSRSYSWSFLSAIFLP